ncbi:MAG: hypothetical protein R3C44_09930 [Chloroflexota bacterium]
MNTCIERATHKWLLFPLVATVILAGFVISNRKVTAQPQEDFILVLSTEDKASGVSYHIGIEANEVVGQVDYDFTATGIEKYREFNDRELTNILQNKDATDPIPVRITFSKPLDQAAFTQFVDEYGIDVNFYTIYMLEPDGKVATISGSPSDTELVPGRVF